MSDHFIPPDHDDPPGNFCRRCGDFIAADQLHLWALGPQAGHYCFGCEPAGCQITTVPVEDCDPTRFLTAWEREDYERQKRGEPPLGPLPLNSITAVGAIMIKDAEIETLRNEVSRLQAALDESVKLQSHYASLLNQYDGGKRLQFADREAWIERLAQTSAMCREGE